MKDKLDSYYIDKGIPTPLYFQIKQHIRQMILDGKIQVGEMLPTEKELCNHLLVSRPTVRQALNELVVEGLLTRKKGKGTQVAYPKVDTLFFQKLETFNAEMRQKGLVPSTRVLSLEKVPGTLFVNSKLGLSPNEELIRLTRLRFANGEPMVYLNTHIPYAAFPDILNQNLELGSLYDYLEEVHNVRVQRVRREIEAVNATRKLAELLGVRTGTALCRVETVACAENGHPVEYSVAHYLGDRNKFSIELCR